MSAEKFCPSKILSDKVFFGSKNSLYLPKQIAKKVFTPPLTLSAFYFGFYFSGFSEFSVPKKSIYLSKQTTKKVFTPFKLITKKTLYPLPKQPAKTSLPPPSSENPGVHINLTFNFRNQHLWFFFRICFAFSDLYTSNKGSSHFLPPSPLYGWPLKP